MLKVTRTLVYEGEEKWVRNTLELSYIQPDKPFRMGKLSIIELEREEEKKNG